MDGSGVPHSSRVEDLKLVIEPSEAEDIRLIFALYGELKSPPALVRELDQRGVKSRGRRRSSGQSASSARVDPGKVVNATFIE